MFPQPIIAAPTLPSVTSLPPWQAVGYGRLERRLPGWMGHVRQDPVKFRPPVGQMVPAGYGIERSISCTSTSDTFDWSFASS